MYILLLLYIAVSIDYASCYFLCKTYKNIENEEKRRYDLTNLKQKGGKVMKVIGGLIIGGIVLYCFVSFIMVRLVGKIIFATPTKFVPTKEKVYEEVKSLFGYNMEYYETWIKEEFTIKNEEHIIHAEYHPIENPKGVAIIAHGFGQNRYVMVPQAEILRRLGFSTILFDQRAFGMSIGEQGTFGEKEGADVAKLIDWAREKFGENTRIVLCGASMGAMAVLNSQKYTREVDAIIEDSSPDCVANIIKPFYKTISPLPNPFLGNVVKQGMKRGVDLTQNNPVEIAAKINVPVLVMHGDADRVVPVEMGKHIYSVLKNPKSYMEIFKGKDHTLEIIEFDRYYQVVKKFIESVISENEESVIY